MQKLSLDLDQLSVESFDTTSKARRDGTVRAHGYTGTTGRPVLRRGGWHAAAATFARALAAPPSRITGSDKKC